MASGGVYEIHWSSLFDKLEMRGVVLVDKLQTLTGKAKSTAYRLLSDAVRQGHLVEITEGREKLYRVTNPETGTAD